LIELTGSGYFPRGRNEVLKIETFLFHPPLGKETFHPYMTFHPGDISSKKSFHPAAAHIFFRISTERIRSHSSRFTPLQDFTGYGFGRTLRGFSSATDCFADFHRRWFASRIFIGDGLLRGFSSSTDCFANFHRRSGSDSVDNDGYRFFNISSALVLLRRGIALAESASRINRTGSGGNKAFVRFGNLFAAIIYYGERRHGLD